MATALLPQRDLSQRTGQILQNPNIDRWIIALTWTALAAGTLWRLGRYFLQFPLWGDEAFVAINFLDRDFWQMTHKLDHGQVAPILFLWLEWLAYQWWGPSELALRLFPVLAGLAGLLLFWRFCRFTLPPRVATLAGCILAVSYYPARHAVEVKPYSFDLLATMLLLLPTVHWLRCPEKIRWLAVLTLLTPLALGSSYPAIFIAGACSLVLLPRVWKAGFGATWVWFVVFNLAMVGTFVAHMMFVGREQLDPRAGTVYNFLHEYWKDWFPPENWLALPLWLLKAHTWLMMAYPHGGSHYGSTLTLLLCLIGTWSVWRYGKTEGEKGRKGEGEIECDASSLPFSPSPFLPFSLLTLCLAPFALSLVAAFLHRYPYGGSARLAQHLAPAICILMAFGIVRLLNWLPHRSWRQRGTALILAGLIAIPVGGLIRDICRPYKNEGDPRIRQTFQDLANRSTPGDGILVFNTEASLRSNMVWYMRLTNLPISWPGSTDWPKLDTDQHSFWGISVRGEAGLRRPPEELLAGSRAEWTLTQHEERAFPKDSIDVPEQKCEVFHWLKR